MYNRPVYGAGRTPIENSAVLAGECCFHDGLTLEQINDSFGISRRRV